MIVIEGIPVLAARLAAEQKAKDWLAKTRKTAPNVPSQKGQITRASAVAKRNAKAA